MSNARRSLLDPVADRTAPIGIRCFTGDHKLIDVLGETGFDYVWLDTEHSALNPRALEDTMRACEAAGLIPLVRIPDPPTAPPPDGRWRRGPRLSSSPWCAPRPTCRGSSTT